MKDNLEIVRQACIKANPSILELGFGCEINSLGHKYTVVETMIAKVYARRWGEIGPSSYYILTTGAFEILGRKIGLADVLLAIKAYKIKLDFDTRSQPFLFITDWKDRTIIWNLKDDIREQSPETIEFLASLLK